MAGKTRDDGSAYRFDRRPGCPFDCPQVEDYVQARARGSSIAVSAQHAGVSRSTGLRFEDAAPVRERLRELRDGSHTLVTVSLAWVAEQLKMNALEAREEKQYKASNEALELLRDMLRTDEGIITGGVAMPAAALRSSNETREGIRSFLTSRTGPEPIVVAAAEQEREAEEVSS